MSPLSRPLRSQWWKCWLWGGSTLRWHWRYVDESEDPAFHVTSLLARLRRWLAWGEAAPFPAVSPFLSFSTAFWTAPRTHNAFCPRSILRIIVWFDILRLESFVLWCESIKEITFFFYEAAGFLQKKQPIRTGSTIFILLISSLFLISWEDFGFVRVLQFLHKEQFGT